MQRALTGIQPSGDIHLGNYLGSILPAIGLQQTYQGYYFIADYHALTSTKDPERLRQASLEVAASFIAAGLDTERNCLFRQSDILEVTELAWVLACQVGTGMLDRGHAVKAAREGGRQPNAGTLFYPVLMAADILLYDSNVVPVGEDQRQHIEIARDIAQSINHHYGDGTLVVPEPVIQKDVGIVPGIDGRKMSKSYGNGISVWSTAKKLQKRIRKIVSATKSLGEPLEPEGDNVLALYKLFASEDEVAQMVEQYRTGAIGYGHAKQALYEAVNAQLEGPRARYDELMAHPEQIEAVLDDGAQRARIAARATMERVRRAVGLR